MTPQEIQIAVAEKMGWTGIQRDGATRIIGQHPKSYGGGSNGGYESLPPYTTSLDAIQRVALEKFKAEEEQKLFNEALWFIVTRKDIYWWQLTAADWCEAFLATCKEIEK